MAATTSHKPRRAGGPDGVTVTMLTLAAFLGILSLMAWQLRAAPSSPARGMIVVRRIYQTRVIETVVGGPSAGTSVTQSASSTASGSTLAPATTRAS